MRNNIVMKKYQFLEMVESVYGADSIDFLICLRDSINILIRQKSVGGLKPYDRFYKGLISFER